MKIFSKEQLYEANKLTTERQTTTTTNLMEQAGKRIYNWMHDRLQGSQVPIHVFCGIGNNGGNGLVLARHLILDGYHVKIYIVNCSDKRSKDFLINYDRIKNVTKKWPTILNSTHDFPKINTQDVIVDAIFGVGLNRPISNWVQNLFKHFKHSKAFTLAIDIPSGLQTNALPTNEHAVVWASYTLSFVTPKLVFFLPETGKYTQHWEVLDIGIDANYLFETTTEAQLIGKHDLVPLYKPRNKFSHKGQFGHSLIIGGSYGKIGAVILASKAALSAGAGLVSAFVPKCGYIPLQTAFPEAMVLTDLNEELLSNIHFKIAPTVIAFGVGAGTHAKTMIAFETFLKHNKTPLLIDADGINLLAKKKTLLKLLPNQTILTPHPKELERLVGSWNNDFEKLNKVKTFSKKHNLIVLIKGANSIAVFEDKLYINTTGNPGLATAGSGDVLTGIITGLISQGYTPFEATLFGVYLHGKSADIAVDDYGPQSLTASHVIEYLGEAYKHLISPLEHKQNILEF